MVNIRLWKKTYLKKNHSWFGQTYTSIKKSQDNFCNWCVMYFFLLQLKLVLNETTYFTLYKPINNLCFIYFTWWFKNGFYIFANVIIFYHSELYFEPFLYIYVNYQRFRFIISFWIDLWNKNKVLRFKFLHSRMNYLALANVFNFVSFMHSTGIFCALQINIMCYFFRFVCLNYHKEMLSQFL